MAGGDHLQAGEHVGGCGNSGNSTQPHLHIPASDSTDWERANGMPIAFRHPDAPVMPLSVPV